MIAGEKKVRCGYSQPNTCIKQFNETHQLKHRQDMRRKKDMWGDYFQPNTSNNSRKTYRLKHRHDRRKEKRYVVVTGIV